MSHKLDLLHPFQREGVDFLVRTPRALLADQMGLGKTVQALSLINAETKIRNALVVCPKSLILNWWNEIRNWISLRKGLNITVTNYEQISGREKDFDLLLVDEAQYIKNPESVRAGKLAAIAARIERIVMLSGTPLQNRPIELWNLLRILQPEKWTNLALIPELFRLEEGQLQMYDDRSKTWGQSDVAEHHAFGLKFCDAKRKFIGRQQGFVKQASWMGSRGGGSYSRIRTAWDYSGCSNPDELAEKMSPIFLRRIKREVFPQMPPKQHQLIVFPDEGKFKDEHLIPELTEANFEESIRKLRGNKIEFAEWTTKRHAQGLAKVPRVIERVESILREEQKVIIFAHHNDVIQEIVKGLGRKSDFPGAKGDFGLVWVSGEITNVKDRQYAVDDFQRNSRIRVFVGSIGTAGVGITLTAASRVVFAEISPVPGEMDQAEDRADRIGQKEQVNVEYLLTDGSLDAKICKILLKKRKIIEKVIGL